jgi:DNA helicase HerA-like ATPase
MCGQSRSGKTFALGIILEKILLSKNAPRIIVLDPNSDFTSLDQMRSKLQYDATLLVPRSDETYAALKDEYGQIATGIRILRPSASGSPGLRIRLDDLDRYEQGAVLQLDPIRDLQVFNAFSKVIAALERELYSWEIITDKLMRDFAVSTLDLGLRIQNLRVAQWEVWCRNQEPSIVRELEKDDWRCIVIDLGSLRSAEEKAVAVIAVLNYLWRVRNPDRPVLLVADEAHNICPHDPSNQMERICTDYIIRIAGEGLKYGLRLLLATQRPAKIHANVSSQCENLILMRMNTQSDLDGLGATFSQAPPMLVARSRYFRQGESLIIGEIVKTPTFAKFEGRISYEGGRGAPLR